MFKFLKDKLKGAISKFTEKVEETEEEKAPEEEQVEEQKEVAAEVVPEEPEEKLEPQPEVVEKKEEVEVVEEKPLEKEETVEKKDEVEMVPEPFRKPEPTPEPVKEEKPVQEEAKEEKKGFFSKLGEKFTTTTISADKFDDLFQALEVILLENNVAFEVIEKMKEDLSKAVVDKPLKRGQVESTIKDSLKGTVESLFTVEPIDLVQAAKEKEGPLVVALFGINGSGKTTSIGKLAHYLKENGLSCVLAAADTFRAASMEQLQFHADKLQLKMIKHDYGSDPAAVAFDAIKHAEAKHIDVVLIDTAGRLHNQQNLLEEMKKIIRVAKPDLKIFVGESITGNDCVEQAKSFDEAVGIDGLILTKADVDEKGGAAISISHVTGKPIVFIGMGQEYSDLKKFEPAIVVESLGL